MVQLGVVLGIHHHPVQALPIIELQALVAALTLTALYLGVMIDERQRANERAEAVAAPRHRGRNGGRDRARGESAAHRADQLRALGADADRGRTRPPSSAAVIERMLAEAQRASEVVRRLRDFFREGRTRLERVPVAALLESVRGARKAATPSR